MENGQALNGFMKRVVQGETPSVPIAQTLGFTVTSVAAGRATVALEADPARHANPMGTLHGGVLATLADTAMGMAYAAQLGVDETFTTLELKINFLRPVWQGKLIATGRVVQAGRTVGLTECDIHDAQGRLVARASSTCMTLRGDHGTDRHARAATATTGTGATPRAAPARARAGTGAPARAAPPELAPEPEPSPAPAPDTGAEAPPETPPSP